MATILASRNKLYWEKVPGGLPSIVDVTQFTGNIFYVDSAAAGASDTAGHGTHPDKPFATIDFAVGQCRANQGDVIFVLPGHAETINTAAAIDLDVAGISVIGLGNGEDRPTITVGSTLDTTTVEIGAADVKLKNVILQPGNDGVDILLDVNADGALIEDCELRSDEANAYQADTYIDVNGGANGADRCTIRRCKITSVTAGATQAIEIGAVEDALLIEDCWIDGDFTAAGIHSASIFTSALIQRNAISNRNTGNHAVEFTAACTGLFVDNRMYGDTLGTILDPGSLKCLGNLETDAVDQAGVDSPRTSAGGFPNDSITAAAIATNAIDADAMADGAITAATFAAGAIDATAIANGAIDASTFAAGAIDAAAIANGAIDAATFAAGAIDAAALAADAVAEIADGVTDEAVSGHVTAGTVGAMLQPMHSGTAAAGAAGTITLAAGAVATDDYYNGAVVQVISGTGVGQSRVVSDYTGATKVANVVPNWATTPDNTSVYVVRPNGPVRVEAITAGVIAAASFAAGAVDAAAIANGAIDAATFAAGAIDAAAIATNAIDADAMADGAITAGTFAAGAIDATAIANGAIDAATFAAGAIDAAAIATNAIDADAMADGAITAATFAAGAIDATAIANGAIDAATFAAGAIDAAAIANGAIDANTFAAGAVNAAAIAASALTATKFAGSIENCVEKSDGAMLNGADDLFTITGGPIKAQVVGIVTTVIGAVVATGKLQITTTTPAATVDLSTAVNIENDAAGTSYRFVGATGVLTPDTNGAKIIDPVTVEDCWFLMPIGTVKFFGSAANTGVIAWYLRYKPLSPSSVVVAAA